MPIIEPRKGPSSKKSPQAKPNQPQNSFEDTGKDRRPARGFISILALVLGTTIPLAGYYYWNNFAKSTARNPSDPNSVIGTASISAAGSDGTLAIQRFAKIASIAALSKKEFEVNFISLEEAKQAGNPQIIAALEIVINKKRQELAESKEKMIESLLELNLLRQAQPSIFDGLVKAAILDAKNRGENETERELELLTAILRSVPTSAPAKIYFSDAIENRL